MALADWVEIYADETTAYLRGLRSELVKQGEASYAAQGQGSKNYQLAVSEFRDKLQAITRILKQRDSGSDDDYRGRADFSGLGGIS